jgi:hypothetical protein
MEKNNLEFEKEMQVGRNIILDRPPTQEDIIDFHKNDAVLVYNPKEPVLMGAKTNKALFRVEDSFVVRPQREVAMYIITFCADTAFGTPPEPIKQNAGKSVIMPGAGNLYKLDAFFNGWMACETGKIYFEGDTQTFLKDTKLEAQWLTLEGDQNF